MSNPSEQVPSFRKRVAVLFGGRSVEHEISIISALEVLSALDGRRYDATPVYIDLQGRWFSGEAVLDRKFYRELPGSLRTVHEVCLLPQPGINALLRKDSNGAFSFEEKIPIDIFFPVFHGQFGEDGCIQGLFELAEVPYVGSNVLASSVLMSKYTCKCFLRDHGIPVLPATVVEKYAVLLDPHAAIEQIGRTPGLEQFPLFVKPGNLGSSVGISRAASKEELLASLALVFRYDTQAIIEPCVTEMFEINVSVIRIPGTDEVRVSAVEIPVSKSGTLTYEEKYLSGGKKTSARGMASLVRSINPPDLDESYKRGVSDVARRAFDLLGCSGVGRFDFIVDKKTGQFYFNELNSPPGSLAYYLWAKSDPPLLYTELLNLLLEQAESGFARKATLDRNLGFRALFR